MRRLLIVTFCLAAAGAAAAYCYLATYGFSARATPSALEAAVARQLRSLATPSSVKDLTNPLAPTPLLIAEARDHFADHCAVCHANDGSGKTPISEGLYPPTPDLREANTQGLTDGEILYVIREGVRFTGMPGWGGSDEDNWKLVLFIRHLPDLSSEELDLMREINAEGH